MVPLAALAHFSPGHTPLSVNHQGPFVAATISFNMAPGHGAQRSADGDRDAVALRIHMPSTIRGAFAGTALTSQQAQSGQLVLIGAALLAGLYRARHAL